MLFLETEKIVSNDLTRSSNLGKLWTFGSKESTMIFQLQPACLQSVVYHCAIFGKWQNVFQGFYIIYQQWKTKYIFFQVDSNDIPTDRWKRKIYLLLLELYWNFIGSLKLSQWFSNVGSFNLKFSNDFPCWKMYFFPVIANTSRLTVATSAVRIATMLFFLDLILSSVYFAR